MIPCFAPFSAIKSALPTAFATAFPHGLPSIPSGLLPNLALTIPRFRLPPLVEKIGHKLPQWPYALLMATVLNQAIKAKFIPEDSLAMMEERDLLIEVKDSGTKIALTFKSGFFHALFAIPESPAIRFSANLSAFLQIMARQEDPDTLFFNRELDIEGDTELGLVIKNMFDAIEWPTR